ncbi:hypothetical protein H6503_00035 [Candidatus Woesearchaeota archaeon]|nr:hypothetical protein [Candidatus Woesearchaeota archaeon]
MVKLLSKITLIPIMLFMAILLVAPVFAYYDADRENYYRYTDYYGRDGRQVRVQENPYNYDNYIVDYYGSDYPRTTYNSRVVYAGSDYGKTIYNSDERNIQSRNHAYYTDNDYGSVRYVDSGVYTDSAYGTRTVYDRDDYTYYNYGKTSSNAYASTRYTNNEYGSNNNYAGIQGTSYTYNSYGTGQARSSLDGYTYTQPYYYARYPSSYGNNYEVYHVPAANTYRDYNTNYDYKVKVYKVNQKSYEYDGYPLN